MGIKIVSCRLPLEIRADAIHNDHQESHIRSLCELPVRDLVDQTGWHDMKDRVEFHVKSHASEDY